MKSNLRFLKIFMVLIAFLVGNFAFAQQKVLTEKGKLANEGLIKIENIATDNNNIVVPPIGYNKALYQFVDFSKHSPKGLLIDNGPFVTNPGGGPGGSDISLLESPNTSYGSNCNFTGGYYVADDFTATSTWAVDSLVFYGYQTNSTTTSTFTGLYVQIWNGDPSLATSSVVWGDLTTNILTSTYWSGCYRATDLVTTARPIMCNVAATPGLVLPAGDYWVEWTCTGSLSSGPWANPISILGQIVTGNAKQWTGAAWADIIDSGSGGAKGLPFLIYGTGGSLPTNDMAMMSILTPITGPNLTATETVSVRVINNGTATQSNIPVSYTVNGGTAVNEVIPGPVAGGAQLDYTFTQTADLSAVQTYAFVSTVSLSGDENPANNSKTKSVTNLGNMILMQNGTMSACDGTFYDSGGPDGTYQNSENYTLTLAPSTAGAKIKFNFTSFDLETNWDYLKVYDGPDATAPMIGNFTGTTIPAALVELIASPSNTSGAITFNFTSDGSGTNSGWVAAISCVLPLTHDLAASSVSGNVTPTSGTSSDYTVTVTNAGVQAESGANYTVSLYDANNVLIGTANGVDIAVGQSIPFVIPWTPSTTGPTYIYGKVTLAGDQNPINDQTPNFNVNVQAAGLIVVTIGTGTELPSSPKTPFDFYWKNSLAESLYFPDEINQAAGTQITQIAYHNSFTSDITSTPIKIFMGETTVNDLTGGWISANDLTTVYDGTAAFPAGINDVLIPLTTPYTYNGGNLVIMTNRPMDTQYYLSADKFFSTTSTTHTSRTLAVNNDNTLFDPYAPPTGTTPLDLFPNTTLYFTGGNPSSAIYESDFESFTAGGQVACQDPTNWTTWSNAPCGTEDAYVSTDFAHGGVNAVKDELSNDLVLPMGNKTAGKYEFSFWMYIPANHGGYYNLLHNFAGSSSEWGLEFYFLDAGTAELHAGGVVTSVPYTHDQWFKVKNEIDLDADQAKVYLDDVLVYTWQWSLDPTNGTAGLNQLSAVDFFSGSGATGIVNPLYYFDDLVYKEIVVTPSLYATDFESFTAGGQVACQDPTNWTTWSNAPCSPTEDAYVSTDFAHSGVNSVKDEGVNDLVLNLGNKTTGSYEFDFSMYIPTDFCGYYNILQDFAGSSSTWGLEVYFHTDGSGIINAGGNGTATFTYNHDLWMPIKNVIDLDNDQAELYIDGNLIYTWQWSLGATGSAGINQLSAVDFFAGADANYTTDVPKYYFDDIDYKAMAAPAVPRIVVTPASLAQDLMPNTTATQTLNIANTGGADLTYNIDIAYNVKSVKVINHNAKYERVTENVPMKGGQVMVEKQGSKLIPSVVNPADIAMSSKAVNKFAPQFSRATVYYNQTGNPSAEGAIASQNFTDLPDYACQGADDFVVPSGATWNVSHVFVNGIYYNGGFEVPAADVIFYADAAGIPGAALYTFTAVPAVSDATGNVNVFLPSAATLTAGTYWVSVAAAMDYTTHFQWMWGKEASPTMMSEFQWQNPGNGFGTGYTTWTSGAIVWSGTVDQNLSFALTDSTQAPPPEGWLAANPLSGTVPAGGNVNIEVTFDATGLPLGTYNGNIAITSNDPTHPVTNVPATLTVKVPGQMPLIEDWASGSFTTNEWTFDPNQSNWSVTTSTGNPAPSAQFSWSPSITNYSVALVSRMLDASAITDNVTLKYDLNLNNYSTSTLEGMAVEVYDGTTWQLVHDYQNTNGSFDWISESYNITQWAAGHSFSVRFRAYGANSFNINYWYLDNIKVYQQVVGNLAGTVTKFTGGAPVEGALITINNALSGTYTATTAADGTYAINGAEAGDYALTVAKEGYNVIDDNVTIVGNQTVTKDYQMTAPTISVDPTSVTVTVPVGQTTTSTVTLHNDGDGPLAWNGHLQSNKEQVSIPASNGNFEHTSASAGVAPVVNKTNVTSTYKGAKGSIAYGFDVNNGIFMSFDIDDPSNPTTIANVSITPFGGTFDASNTDFMYVIDYNDGAIKKVDVATGNVTTVGAAGLQSGNTPTGLTCDKSTGILYAACTSGSESLLYTVDPSTGAATLIGPTGIPALIDIAIDGTGQMYGYDIVGDNAYKIDKTNGTATMLGSIGFDASYAQGMGWDPASDAIYMAAYNVSTGGGELRLFDKVTGNTAVLGSLPGEIDAFAFPGGSGGGWASIEPPSGVIAPGGSQPVIITFDGSYVPPQKDLTVTGNLVFNSDPNVGQATVALSMTIQGPFFGILNGTVTHGGTPVEGVTVTATREESPVYTYTMVTGADGAYSFPSTMYGTYDITATKEGFNPYEALGIVVVGDQTTTHNINILAPVMVINPTEIIDSAAFGSIITRTIIVDNTTGDGTLEWAGNVSTNNKQKVSIPASNGDFPRGTAPVSIGRAPNAAPASPSAIKNLLRGSTGYAFDVYPGYTFFSFDTDDPATQNVISSIPDTYYAFGGTFDGTNTDFMYVLDANVNALTKVDIASGNVTTIGPCTPYGGQSWTGIQVDKTADIMYGVSTDINESYIYQIDMTTGAATVIAPTGIPGCIDIAIDGDGQMYGFDLVGDNSYKIDKETGTSTMLGSIGYDANYAQGMSWDPETDNIYLAAYNNASGTGELRILDRVSGNTEYVGTFGGEIDALGFPGGGSNWLSIDPKSGIVPPGTTQEVTVTLDGNYIPPQKDYTLTGDITFTSNPNVGTTAVPVTFTVEGDIYGILTGTVTHNGNPVAGVIVTAQKQGSNYSTTSGTDGVYAFPQILGGTYTVSAEATGYNPFSTTGVVITGGQTTTLSIALTAPIMVINPTSLTVNVLPGATIDQTITVNNTGNGDLDWTSTLVTNGKRSVTPLQFTAEPRIGGSATGEASPIHTTTVGTPIRALWDILFTFNGNYAAQPGVETDGQYIYTSSWQSGYGSWFHKYALDGTWIEDFDIAGATAIRDLAYDGQYFYGGANGSTIYQMDFTNKVLIGTINTSVAGVRHIAYDSQDDAFWVGGWSDIQEVNRSGATINSGSTGLSGMYGSAYDPWTAGGPYLWIFDQGGNGVDIQQYSIANGALTGVMHDASDIPGFVSGSSLAGGLCISNTAVAGKIALIGNIQNDPQTIFAYDLGEATAPWITRTPASGTLAPGATQNVTVHFDATDLTVGDYTATITFASDPNVGTVIVPVLLHVGFVNPTTLTIANVTAETGSPVSVPVHAVLVDNMGSFQFSIEYDPALLTYTGTSNWFAGIDAVTIGNPSPGHLTFVWAAEMEGINIPDGNFFNMDFTWNGTTGQTSPLTWSDDPTPREFGDYNGVIFTPTYVNGSVTGSGPVPTVTITNNDTIVPGGPFTVAVNAKDIVNMGSFQFTIEYDPTIMTYDTIANWYPGITAVTVGNPSAGHLTFVWAADLNGINIPDGKFFDIGFNWIAGFGVQSMVTWSDNPTPREFADYDGNIFVPVYENGIETSLVGIPEIGIASNSVFPNPATDLVNIKVSNDIRTVQVMNNLGMVISSATVAQEKIINLNTSNYSAGTYFVRFISENGKTTVKKLVIIK